METISPADLKDQAVWVLGCPAMGAEVIEEDEMEPFVAEVEGFAAGKTVGLFGSYGWGGSYMHDWEARITAAGAQLIAPGVLAMDEPDQNALKACAEIGRLLSAQ